MAETLQSALMAETLQSGTSYPQTFVFTDTGSVNKASAVYSSTIAWQSLFPRKPALTSCLAIV